MDETRDLASDFYWITIARRDPGGGLADAAVVESKKIGNHGKQNRSRQFPVRNIFPKVPHDCRWWAGCNLSIVGGRYRSIHPQHVGWASVQLFGAAVDCVMQSRV